MPFGSISSTRLLDAARNRRPDVTNRMAVR
jgi:hypothetical protein